MMTIAHREYLVRMNPEGGQAFRTADVERIYRMLFTSAAEGLVVVDASGNMLMQNPRLCAMFGYEMGELDGQPVEVLLPSSLHDRHVAHRARYNSKPMQRSMGMGMNLEGRRKDGSTLPVEVSLNHFDLDGVRYVMGLVTDITLRRKAEQELQRINQELEERVEQRTAELREAERSVREALEKERELHTLKSRFVAMASHEFRTPLSTIMSSVDLVGRYTEGGSNEKVEKHLVRIRSKVREMTAMLNDLLSLERIEQGQVKCAPSTFDLPHLCIELIEELRPLAKPGQAIDYDHQSLDRAVILDRQMLGGVISNLLTNALKYSEHGGHVRLATHITDRVLRIEVGDDGIGIPEEDQQHLFERFFRGANSTNIQGTGLGLNIVKRYLELMNGGITFTSAPGATVFKVTLPQHLPIE